MNKLTINGQKLAKSFIFSAGEVQIRLPELGEPYEYYIKTTINSSDTLMELILVADALSRLSHVVDIVADIGYMPYARQDRVCFKGEAFSFKVALDMLAISAIGLLIIDDFHGSQGLLPSWVKNRPLALPKDITLPDFLICPDKGAISKVKSLELPVIYANKTRNPENGYLVYDDLQCAEIEGKDVLIVDDICDGGKTFELLAEKLMQFKPNSIALYVTHGIFSKGKQVLYDAGITKITCLNDFSIDND